MPRTPPRALPNELVEHILLELGTTAGDEHDYRERQDALRQCCLVSHAFRRRSQPVLQEYARFSTVDAFDALSRAVDEQPALAQRIRVLNVACVEPGIDVFGLTERLPQITEFSYSGMSEEQMAISELFETMPNLRHLTLNTVYLPRFPSFPVHKQLQKPALCALRLDRLQDVNAQHFGDPFDLSSCPHLNRLDFLQLTTSVDLAAVVPRSLTVPVLYTCELLEHGEDQLDAVFTNLDTLKAQHLQLVLPDDLGEPDSEEWDQSIRFLGRFNAWLGSTGALRTLSLPGFYTPSDMPPEDDFEAAVQATLAACEKRGTEVSWRWEVTVEEDEGLSHSFWRYARQLKAEKANEA
ncbi:hypothetical protein JCM8097_004530 [Rhodosporidiobolus ruineniae]